MISVIEFLFEVALALIVMLMLGDCIIEDMLRSASLISNFEDFYILVKGAFLPFTSDLDLRCEKATLDPCVEAIICL